MRKNFFIPIAVLSLMSTSAHSYEMTKSESAGPLALDSVSKRLMDESFVVETSDDDATDSLNRVTGTIDKGFVSKEYTYRSEHHGRSGPFATHEDAYDVS